ncbi:MAG: GGDEF domain-containing protein [Planctomycetota bacterium]|nr:GGDEF domain-containing protein [Planctomycetota bacterium]
MSENSGQILVLACDEVAGELSALSQRGQLPHFSEPYDALSELARRQYEAVIISQDYPDFAGLVRAARRLQCSTRLIALTDPAGEADLQMSGNGELDGYFIYPPTSEELQSVLSAPRRADEPDEPGMRPKEVAELVEAAGDIDTLAEQIARCVGAWTGAAVHWADKDDGMNEPLLLLDADPPRVLLADDSGVITSAGRAKLAALQVLVGPLSAQARRTEALHRLAITDHLTGAYNRRYFYHFTDRMLERAGAERFHVTLLLFDIDDFKRYNDTYGHAAGDEILREIVSLMKQTTRRHDVVARIGGDEFTVLFWDAEPPRRPDSRHPETAHVLAERFVKKLSRHDFPSLGPEARGALTISGGLASFPWDGKTCRELLRRADVALRQAKTSGKNGIRIVGEEK